MRAHGPNDWDSMARRFDGGVCHVLAEDRGHVVARALADEARRRGRRRRILVGDFGCGIGRALPLLARSFGPTGEILAVDGSSACLARARSAVRGARNIAFVHADLAARRLSLPRVDVGLCINVALTPDDDARERLLANVAGHVRRGGRLFLVVPSLESDLLVRRRFVDWAGEPWRAKRRERVADGIVDAGGVLTKHWTREELLLLAPRLASRAVSIARVEYGWHTELVRPPKSFREPYPWDWLVVLERRSPRR
ncbi:MAG TPA: class I SAM-dependent methyltransferase [Planctomycetota bacterium]|jgi:SAM-dependent methyltransferase|nr:class I SAM-dependent methyltransferase [Planctomycetota bacterium]